MTEGPLNNEDKEKILEETIEQMERQIDEVIRKSKREQDLKNIFRIELDINPKTENFYVKQTIIDKYKEAGWSNVRFETRNFRNETMYQIILEQA